MQHEVKPVCPSNIARFYNTPVSTVKDALRAVGAKPVDRRDYGRGEQRLYSPVELERLGLARELMKSGRRVEINRRIGRLETQIRILRAELAA